MLTLSILEVCSSNFCIRDDNKEFELCTQFQNKHFSLEDIKTDDKNFRPQDHADELLRPFLIDKLKRISV